jgi:ankyrin repeat protein
VHAKTIVDGSTPLHVASQHGRAEVVMALLDEGADVSTTDSYGNTPLLLACDDVDLLANDEVGRQRTKHMD